MLMVRYLRKSSSVAALAIVAGASLLGIGASQPASASLIFAGNIPNVSGGVGNSNIVLSLSSPGATSTETGAVTPAGCTGDIQNPCKSPSNDTPTFASAGVTSAQNLVIYLDAQEPGNDNLITANSLTLNVFAASGNSSTALFSASLAGTPLDLTTCPGQGNNCVNSFVLNTQEAQQLQSIFASDLRVGLSSSLSNATGGPDRFFLANRSIVSPPPPPPPPPPIPAPASLALLGGALVGFGLLRLRKAA